MNGLCRARKLKSLGSIAGGLALMAVPVLLLVSAKESTTWLVSTSAGVSTFGTQTEAEEYVRSFRESGRPTSYISVRRIPPVRNTNRALMVIYPLVGCLEVARGVWRWLVPFAVLVKGVLLIRPTYSSRVAIDIVHTPLTIRGASIVLDADRDAPIKLDQLDHEGRGSLVAAIKDARREDEQDGDGE